MFLLLSVAGNTAAAGFQADAVVTPEKQLKDAEVLIDSGKLDEAIASLERLRVDQPNLASLEARLGKAYYQKRSFRQAIAHLRIAVEQNPKDHATAQLLGLSFYSAGQLLDAIPLLEKVERILPATELDPVYLLGVSYLRTQQPEKARIAFARMFGVPPDSAAAHFLFAQMMVRQRLEEQAIPELKRAISLDARLPMVRFLLGEIYLYQSKPQLALEEFQKELEISPTVWLVYWRIGDAYTRLEKYPEAERVLKQAIWLNESFTGPYVLLGQVGLKKGDLELARGFLERAIKMDPNNYQAHLSLAKVYQRLNRTDDAKREFESARVLRKEKNTAEELLFTTQK